MKIKLGLVKEMVFYISLFTYIVMWSFDLHFISKIFGAYMLIFFTIINVIYIKHVYHLSKSKKKCILVFIMPLIAFLSMNTFVLISFFVFSIGIFTNLYERTIINRIVKIIYGFSMAICILLIWFSGIFAIQIFSEDDRYIKYVMSPDQEHVITVTEIGIIHVSEDFEYRLEDVYLKVLRKDNQVLLNSYREALYEINWHSNNVVKINGGIYNLKN